MKYAPLKEIRVEELIAAGYREDKSAEHRYKYHAFIVLGVGFAAFVAGIVLVNASSCVDLGMFVIYGSWCWLFFGSLVVHFSRPKSSQSGKTMEIYFNLSIPDDCSQIIYVSPESKTFFRGPLNIGPGPG